MENENHRHSWPPHTVHLGHFGASSEDSISESWTRRFWDFLKRVGWDLKQFRRGPGPLPDLPPLPPLEYRFLPTTQGYTIAKYRQVNGWLDEIALPVDFEPASEPATPPEDYDWEVEATAAWFEDLSLFSDPHESDIPSELVEFREAYRHWKLTEWAVEISSHGSAASGIQQARPPTESLSGDELSTPSPAESEGELEPANQPPFLN